MGEAETSGEADAEGDAEADGDWLGSGETKPGRKADRDPRGGGGGSARVQYKDVRRGWGVRPPLVKREVINFWAERCTPPPSTQNVIVGRFLSEKLSRVPKQIRSA